MRRPALRSGSATASDDYEWVRAKPTGSSSPAATAPEIEHVVEREGDHVVVEKLGIAARIATKLNPRAAEA